MNTTNATTPPQHDHPGWALLLAAVLDARPDLGGAAATPTVRRAPVTRRADGVDMARALAS